MCMCVAGGARQRRGAGRVDPADVASQMRAQRLLLYGNVVWTAAQLAAGAAVLAVSANDSCDAPLTVFIVVYMVSECA
jgi:hypothetical protein